MFFFFFSRTDSLKVTFWFESYVTFVLFRMSQTKECIWTLRSFRVILLIAGEQAACLFFLVKSPICYQSFHEGPANTVWDEGMWAALPCIQQAWTAPPFLRRGTVVGPAALGWVCGTRTLSAALFSVVAAGLGCLYRPWSSPGQVLEWVAFPFSRGSSQPRNGTRVSCIAGGFFTSWATREAPCACGAREMWLVWTAVFSACKVRITFQKLHLMNIL